jgi:hypothetical protein
MDLMKVGTDLGIGAVAGVLDQVVANADANRGNPSMLKSYSTYLNYGVPILAVAGIATNMLRGDMAIRLATIGGQLAGRQITQKVTHRAFVKVPATWNKVAAESAMRHAAPYSTQNAQEILV